MEGEVPRFQTGTRPGVYGLTNARPETIALSQPPVNMQDLPFDVMQYLQYELPWEYEVDPDIGN